MPAHPRHRLRENMASTMRAPVSMVAPPRRRGRGDRQRHPAQRDAAASPSSLLQSKVKAHANQPAATRLQPQPQPKAWTTTPGSIGGVTAPLMAHMVAAPAHVTPGAAVAVLPLPTPTPQLPLPSLPGMQGVGLPAAQSSATAQAATQPPGQPLAANRLPRKAECGGSQGGGQGGGQGGRRPVQRGRPAQG